MLKMGVGSNGKFELLEPATCPVCSKHTSLHDIPLHNDDYWWINCETCGHLWQYPPKVTAAYDAQYVAERYDKYDTTAAMSWLRLGLVKSVCQEGRLLDVGYGNGAFIKVAQKAGFDAYGWDVHGCAEKYGVTELGMCEVEWDVVTFFDSLEHFPSLDEIKRIKARNIIVSLPYRAEGSIPALTWKHLRPGEHLQQFSPVSLAHLVSYAAPYRVKFVDLEDSIRGKLDGKMNILTAVFYR